jgi:hypothetical protein
MSTYEWVLKNYYRGKGAPGMPDDEAEIRLIISKLHKADSHVISNLTKDACIQRKSMIKLLDDLLNYKAEFAKNLPYISSISLESFVHQCQAIIADFIFHNIEYSKRLNCKDIEILGRVITIERFKQSIAAQGYDKDIVYDKVKNNKTLSAGEKCLYTANPERVLWVTWNDKKLKNDPFEFASISKDKKTRFHIIKACMGLDIMEDELPHLLLRFKKVKPGILRYPTVADANNYARFKCVEVSSGSKLPPNGETRPRFPDEVCVALKIPKDSFKYDLPPRPEAIQMSKLVVLDDMLFPPEEIDTK